MNKIIWVVFSLITIIFFYVILSTPTADSGGDIVEYFGITESLINHGSFELRDSDFESLKKYLNPGYFKFVDRYEDVKGGFLFYLPTKDGNRHAGHFVFYSLLALPIRIILRFFNLNELSVFKILNLIILTAANFYIIKKYIKDKLRRLVYLVCVYSSPLIFFIIWPGPDIFFLSLLIVSVFAFYKGKYLESSILSIVSSWHSQPVLIISSFFILYYLIKSQRQLKNYLLCGILGATALIPYFYNYLVFGIFSPWSILKDGWTQIYGFGLQNASLKRLYEQFFDLNIGLFWYAPLLFIIGIYSLFRSITIDKKNLVILVIIIITAFGYQTNPAWQYGTSGFGPTRHVLYAVPFLIYLTVTYFNFSWKTIIFLFIPLVMQFYALTFNGYLTPTFYNSVFHNPYAKFVLDNSPKLYNPTPKIFVDKTNHDDLKYLKSAIYRSGNRCLKAFVLKTDVEMVESICGSLPDKYKKLLENEYLQKSTNIRHVWTISATFWPDSISCEDYYINTESSPSICMKTLDDVVRMTGVSDTSRIHKVEDYKGVWRIEKGDMQNLTIPPGYIIHRQSIEGIYVDY